MPGLQHGRACSSFRNGKRVTQGALHAFPIVSIMQCALTCCVFCISFSPCSLQQQTISRPRRPVPIAILVAFPLSPP